MIALSGWQQREEKSELVLKRKFKSALKARATEQQDLMVDSPTSHGSSVSSEMLNTSAFAHSPHQG